MTGMPRRRFLTILAGTSVAMAGGVQAAASAPLHYWRGTALGAEGSLTLAHADGAKAQAIIAECVAELRRLEDILSLYEPGSALDALNRQGRLDSAPDELVALLAEARTYGELSGGAFDITVQPLWRLYADHFAKADADQAGPPPHEIEAARRLIDFRAIRVEGRRVSLAPGQAVTLNGIAQGWITDRVAELLKARGIENVLVDMGESRAIGDHPEGRPWRLGIPDPSQPSRIRTSFALANRAASTSGGYGMVFDRAGRFSHILNPETGKPAESWASVTVLAATAARADALSTALTVAPPGEAAALLAKAPDASAILIDHSGRLTRL
jgi:thiamine biosynthesis lipoprotein